MVQLPLSKIKLSRRALRHGNLQIRKMLKDRPAMACHIDKNDIIWSWAARKFAGEDLGVTIDWSARKTREGFEAENFYPFKKRLKKQRGFIRVNHVFERLWISAIDALHQVAKAPALEQLYQHGYSGCYQRKEWARKCCVVHYYALKEITRFYHAVWKPWAIKRGFGSDPFLWLEYRSLLGAFEKWMQSFNQQRDTPWEYWENVFDLQIVPCINKQTREKAGTGSKSLAALKFSVRKLSGCDLKHGEKQLIKMLDDRPDMGKYIRKGDSLWKWTVRKFAGENLKDTLDWNRELPSKYDFDYTWPFDGRRGFIQVNDGFEHLWALTIFELNNIALADEVENIYQKAFRGKLGKNDFIRQIANTEFRAIKKTSLFYKKVWRPWFIAKGLSSIPFCWDIWHGSKSISFKQWIAGFGKNSDYPWKFYGDDYDMYVKPYIKKRDP